MSKVDGDSFRGPVLDTYNKAYAGEPILSTAYHNQHV